MTKEELREYRELMAYIRELEDKLLELESQATRVTSQIKQDVVKCSKTRDQLTDTVTKMIELQKVINMELGPLKAKEKRIIVAINTLPIKERRLFYLRYIKGYTWEKVAVETGYCWRQLHRIHGRCLRMIK